jgi:hypothetical protein
MERQCNLPTAFGGAPNQNGTIELEQFDGRSGPVESVLNSAPSFRVCGPPRLDRFVVRSPPPLCACGSDSCQSCSLRRWVELKASIKSAKVVVWCGVVWCGVW